MSPTAKEEDAELADTGRSKGGQTLESAKDEVGHVVDGARHQTRRIVGEGDSGLGQRARVGQQRIAEVVRSLSDELGSMTDHTEQPGPVAGEEPRRRRRAVAIR